MKTIEYEIISYCQPEDESNSSECCYSSSIKSDSDIDVDEEKKSSNKISKQEEKIEKIFFNYLKKDRDM